MKIDEAKACWKTIEDSKFVLIVTHVNPDADTICSGLAISNILYEHDIAHAIFNIGTDIPKSLDFLNRFDAITNRFPSKYDTLISVDCGDIRRLGFKPIGDLNFINIDHHKSNNNFGNFNFVDTSRSSTAEVVFDFLNANGIYISKNTAECIYLGIYDDSLGLSVERCDSKTFDMLSVLTKCGANPGFIGNQFLRRDALGKYKILPKILNTLTFHKNSDIASIYVKSAWIEETNSTYNDSKDALDMIFRIDSVMIALFFREENNTIRVSLRSKNGIDVSVIAKRFDGGGHKQSAGCTIHETDIEKAINMVVGSINGTTIQF